MDGVHQRTSPRSINRLNIGDIIMLQIISIEHQTAVRANVITNRTGDASIGIMKSMMIALLKEKMNNGVAHFIYAKKPNKFGEIEIREAWGTTQSNIATATTNGRGYCKELDNCIAYFDVIKGGWRSFRFESLVKVY